MPEVTKITVTFDDGTEHVVFQVGKVIEEPTPPCTVGDEPCGRTVTSRRPVTQTLEQEVIGGLLERLERPSKPIEFAVDEEADDVTPEALKWAATPAEEQKYEIIPGGHTTHTLKMLLADMFDRGPLKFWLATETTPDEQTSEGLDEESAKTLAMKGNAKLADVSNWVRVMKVHAKNFPPYKDVLDYIGRNKSNQWCGAAPNMPNDDDMIIRIFKLRPGVYDQVVDGLEAPLGIQVVMVTTPTDDQLVGWALQEVYR